MMAFPEMIVGAAIQAGIKVPEDLSEYDKQEYPHWNVYCMAQLGHRIPRCGCHWDNAKVIANITDDKIKLVTVQDLINLGFEA